VPQKQIIIILESMNQNIFIIKWRKEQQLTFREALTKRKK
jgi:hypothetical protein